MNRLRRVGARLRSLFRARQLDRDLDEQIAGHLEEAAQELERSGLSAAEARRVARLQFGNVTQTREAHREARSTSVIEVFGRDLRDACRVTLRRPGFAVVVIGVLGLGVGANSALMSVTHAVLMKPLPYGTPYEIYSVEIVVPERRDEMPSMPVAPLVFLRWREALTTFSGLTAFRPWEVNLSGDGEPERLGGAYVTTNFFDFLRLPMALGRGFQNGDDQPGRDKIVVISDAIWRRRYHADPAIVGRSIRIADEPHQVVGVASPSFLVPTGTSLHPLVPFASRIDLWKPIALPPQRLNETSWDYGVLARLPEAGAVETGRQQLAGIVNELVQQYLPGLKTTGAEIRLVPIREVYSGNVRPRLLLVLAASALLLLTACASLTDLFMARVASRAHEFATRTALGAARGRIVAQILTEVTVLSVLGGILAGGLAHVGARTLATSGPDDVRVLASVAPSAWLWVFALLVSVLAGVACGTMPALQASRSQSLGALREAGRAITAGRRATTHREWLVGLQMTLATLLLGVSALLLHSFVRISVADRGYETDGVLTVDLSLFGSRYSAGESRVAFYEDVTQRVRALPGVMSTGAISDLPALATGSGGSRTIFREDDQPPFQRLMLTRPIARLRSVTTGYFAASGTPLRAGRPFDSNEQELVALMSESLVRRLWPQEPVSSVVGRRVRQAADLNAPLIQIVGVVGDVRPGPMGEAPFIFYRPHPQWASGPMSLVVRTEGDPESIVSSVRSAIRAIDANLPIAEIRTMREVVASTIAERRFQMLLISLFGAVALLVGAVGLYGVVSYSVACRTGEIGLRIAVGAARGDLMRWVFVSGMRPVIGGLAVGLGGAVAVAVILRSLLFEISPADPLSLGTVVGVLVAVSCLACYLPARRAAGIDPMVTLRQ